MEKRCDPRHTPLLRVLQSQPGFRDIPELELAVQYKSTRPSSATVTMEGAGFQKVLKNAPASEPAPLMVMFPKAVWGEQHSSHSNTSTSLCELHQKSSQLIPRLSKVSLRSHYYWCRV